MYPIRVHFHRLRENDRTLIRLAALVTPFTHCTVESCGLVLDFQPDGDSMVLLAEELPLIYPNTTTLRLRVPHLIDVDITRPARHFHWIRYNCAHFCAEVVGYPDWDVV